MRAVFLAVAARTRAGYRGARRGAEGLAARHGGRGDVRRVRHALNVSDLARGRARARVHPPPDRRGQDASRRSRRALVDEYGSKVLAVPRDERVRRGRLARPGLRRRAAGAARRWASRRCAGGPVPEPAARTRARPRGRAAPRGGSARTTGERRRRHDGARRVRGRLRLVHLALRAAARARLPVRGHGRVARGDARGGAQHARILLPAIVFCLSFTVVFVVLGMTATGSARRCGHARHAGQDRRRGDHRARRVLPAHAVRAEAQPGVAPGRADQPRRLGRPAGGRRGVRGGLDALRRAHAGLDPHRRLDAGHRRQGRDPAAFYSAGLAVPFLLTALAFTAPQGRSAGCATAT